MQIAGLDRGIETNTRIERSLSVVSPPENKVVSEYGKCEGLRDEAAPVRQAAGELAEAVSLLVFPVPPADLRCETTVRVGGALGVAVAQAELDPAHGDKIHQIRVYKISGEGHASQDA